MGVKPSACQCTAGRANPKLTHSSEGQLEESRLVSWTLTTTETWDGCLCRFQALAWVRQVGRREGLMQLTSMNVNTCGTITGEICRGSAEAMLAIGFFSSKRFWGCLLSRSLGTAYVPAIWLMLVAFAFLAYSSCLSTSQFCWSPGGVKLKEILCIMP